MTSRSLLDLSKRKIAPDETERDALLAVRRDRRTAELCIRLLLACDAAPSDLPADLEERLRGPGMRTFVPHARTLLVQRGALLADPLLGLTLPFWEEHVGTVRTVLITERPADLLTRSASPLPAPHLLGRWLDTVTATVSTSTHVDVLDPRDVADIDEAEGAAHPEEGFDDPLMGIAAVVDSLIRELEVDAVRPLLALIRTSRSSTPIDDPVGSTPGAPLSVVAHLWEEAASLRHRTADLSSEAESLAALAHAAEEQLEALRQRTSVRLALRMSRLFGGD